MAPRDDVPHWALMVNWPRAAFGAAVYAGCIAAFVLLIAAHIWR